MGMVTGIVGACYGVRLRTAAEAPSSGPRLPDHERAAASRDVIVAVGPGRMPGLARDQMVMRRAGRQRVAGHAGARRMVMGGQVLGGEQRILDAAELAEHGR